MRKKSFEELISWQILQPTPIMPIREALEIGGVYDIELAKKIGDTATVFYCELKLQFEELEAMHKGIAFTIEDLQDLTMLSNAHIRYILNKLVFFGYLECRLYKQPSEEEEKFYIKLKNKKRDGKL